MSNQEKANPGAGSPGAFVPGRKGFSGYRAGVLVAAANAGIVLLINVSLALAGVSRTKTTDTVGTLSTGTCSSLRQTNILLHVVINFFSTILLAGSNYAMQCLTAPTRSQVDRAHANKTWLNIGIPSLRNLKAIGRKRLLVWLLLGLSSLPLHLFYNATIFTTVMVNDYAVFSVPEGFITSAPTSTTPIPVISNKTLSETRSKLQDMARSNQLERLSNLECINTYDTPLQTSHKSVLVVGNARANYGTYSPVAVESIDNVLKQSPWICGNYTPAAVYNISNNSPIDPKAYDYPKSDQGTCIDYSDTKSTLKQNADSWAVMGIEAEYCLSEKVEPQCQLQFSLALLSIVIAFNALKMVLMVFVLFCYDEKPLITLGDAVASFLQKEDQKTKEMDIVSAAFISDSKGNWMTPPDTWNRVRRTRFSGASTGKWALWIACYLVSMIAISALLGYTLNNMSGLNPNTNLFTFGIGEVSKEMLITKWNLLTSATAGIFNNNLIANLPQVVVSLFYLGYNGLFTMMASAVEWDRFSSHRKPLRVSSKQAGLQEMTFYLQLPFSYQIPILFTAGIMHWLVSQSLFPVHIVAYDIIGNVNANKAILTCGFSPTFIVVVLIFTFIPIFAMIIMGFRKLDSYMPVVGTCSAAISTACHPYPREAAGIEEHSLQWGVISEQDGMSYCSFSTGPVREMREGMRIGSVAEAWRWHHRSTLSETIPEGVHY